MNTRPALLLKFVTANRFRLPLLCAAMFALVFSFSLLNGVSAGKHRTRDSALTYRLSTFSPTDLTQQRLTAADGAGEDRFGSSVAVSGDTAFVGAYTDDVGANTDQGSVTVFTRNGANWNQSQQIFAADGAAGDGFGISLAVSGDTLIVGANNRDNDHDSDAGAVYIFTRATNGIWSQQAKLAASDAESGDEFGFAVALDGDTALVGAPLADNSEFKLSQGAAYIFRRSSGVWTQQAKLSAADGTAEDSFGASVALRGESALIGAPFHDANGNFNQGAAYMFTANGATWTQAQKLTAADGAANDRFGSALALNDSNAVIGANGKDVTLNAEQGAAYLYQRSGLQFVETQRLTAEDGSAGDRFGSAVAISGDTVVVGAPDDDVNANENQGSIKIFVANNGSLVFAQTFTGDANAAEDAYGLAVAVDSGTIISSALSFDVGSNADQGAAYIYFNSPATTPTPTPTTTPTPFFEPITLRFSATSYVAAEGAADGQPRVILTVTRSGGEPPLSDGTRVDYSTFDGTAQQRTDYTLASGRLVFAPGESSKNIDISLVDDGYAEAAEQFTVKLSNARGGQPVNIFGDGTATVTITDNDGLDAAQNPIESARTFARQQYLDFLAREPDAPGWDYWTGQITSCGVDALCVGRRRVEVSAEFFLADEFQQSGGFVYRLYTVAYGTSPEYRPGYAQFAPDRARVVGGATLAAGKTAFAQDFVERAEFVARYPVSLTAAEFVDALLLTTGQGTGAQFSAGERAQLIATASGTGGRAAAVQAVAEAVQVQAAVFNRGFVLMQYFGYLRRDPDAAGYAYWVAALAAAQGNYRVMVCNFVTSQEYQERFGARAARTNQECSAP